MKTTLNDLINAKGVSAPLREAVKALVDRLEAAESEALEEARLNGMGSEREAALMARLEAAEKERDALRAKVEAMEQQEPVAHVWRCDNGHIHGSCEREIPMGQPLYLAPGAQPAPIEQDTSVRKAWARFSHELNHSPDAPYPGMSEAFEQHFSQSFTDREWRAESATWAAAWKAAKRHEAQAQPAPSLASGDVSLISEGKTRPAPSVPVAALRPVIDWLRNGCDPMKAADELDMLAAAPEAKP